MVRRTSFVARLRASTTSGTRIAVTAPRSVGTAVVRNRARRRVREAFRRALGAGAANMDILVTVRTEALSAPFPTIAADAASVLREPAR